MNVKSPLVLRHRVCHGNLRGSGYSPLLLQVNHGAGVTIDGGATSTPDMSRAKNLLAGLTIGATKKKKYVSI